VNDIASDIVGRDEGQRTEAGGGGRGCRIIVLGNEKGGSGKSTVAMHLTVALLRMDYRVASIDLDFRQATLSHYIENRRRYAGAAGLALKLPEHYAIAPSNRDSAASRIAEDRAAFAALAADLASFKDFVVVDTPGSSGAMASTALSHADILVTPLNDSFVDLDMLVRVDIHDPSGLTLSPFCQAVLAERAARRGRGRPDFTWYVMRNRLSQIGSRNKRDLYDVLRLLARRFGFHLAEGFSERVIYRELFLRGLTVLDLREADTGVAMSMSHLRARQEVRALLDSLRLVGDNAAAEHAVGLAAGPRPEAAGAGTRPGRYHLIEKLIEKGVH
jgi:chromosome partitioning protein